MVVAGGDFRQLLPVVRHGSRAQVANAALPKSHLWQFFRRHCLTQNMRVREGDGAFAEYLLRIGKAREHVVPGTMQSNSHRIGTRRCRELSLERSQTWQLGLPTRSSSPPAPC